MSDGTTEAASPPPFASSAGFERLDTLVRVTTIQSWVYLATIFGVGVAAAAFAVFYQVPTKVTGEGILLIKQDAIAQVRAQATGRLIRLRVKLGARCRPGAGDRRDFSGRPEGRDSRRGIKTQGPEGGGPCAFAARAHREGDTWAGHGAGEGGDGEGTEELTREAEDRRTAEGRYRSSANAVLLE